ncbi:MAG: hypothetical protein HUK19_09590 [Fibrobacter sp.]|nr:hypothetical protein [Fibrobacter sp.]
MRKFIVFLIVMVSALLVSCAAERQGLVCEEIEYRLNTMTYSPDQRAYMEEELQTCRAEESKKKGESMGKSIYERYADSDSLAKQSNGSQDISVSDALRDSSGVETQSIYDRYSNKNGGPSETGQE